MTLRSLRAGYAMCWQKETNWASVWVWLPFALARPLAGALLIWVMTKAAGARAAGYLEPAWVGNAFFQLVPGVLGGLSWAVIDDRERYQMLKYIYLSPGRLVPWLLGHGLARATLATMGVAVLLAAGAVALGIRTPTFDPALFAAAAALSVVSLLFLGLALAGVALLVARHGHFMTESVGGIFFLLSGAVFPLDVLPVWLRPLAWASPVTWQLELFRRSVGLSFGTSLAGVPTPAVLGITAALTGVSVALGLAGFAACERRARWKGQLDAVTSY